MVPLQLYSFLMIETIHYMQAQMIHQTQDDQIMGPPSLAESRPNAYIPEDLGIPKPYGGFAPFKPSDPGSSMRHIRVPNPREIVI